MSGPKISIIIPSYNRKKMLQRAVSSVVNQSYNNWELVIVDDGSTDGTSAYIKALNHKQIVYIYQENSGRSSARNKGVSSATGTYICFLDSDDELLPNYLEVFRELVSENAEQIYLAGVRLKGKKESKTYLPEREKEKCILQILKGTFNLMPFCFYKSLLTENLFEPKIYYGEDFQFLIPVVLNHKICIKAIETSIVHEHSERTINKVFFDVKNSYLQLEQSILHTIDQNRVELEKFIPALELQKIRSTKVKEFIYTAAKYNLKESIEINNRQQDNQLGFITLGIQRLKGIVQSWIT